MKEIVFDLEGDGLEPTKIHCFCWTEVNSGVVKATTDYRTIADVISSADVVIGHNIIRFDLPVLLKLVGCKPKGKVIDTLSLSWYLYPNKLIHGLADWGEEFGIKKPEIDDWFNLSVEEYIHRCKEDVKINLKLWNTQKNNLKYIYGSESASSKLISYLTFKMNCARKQEESGWKLNVDGTKALLEELSNLHQDKEKSLYECMPKKETITTVTRPAKPYKKDGTLSVAGSNWYSKLKELGLPKNSVSYEKVEYSEPNPNSSDQIKSWLFGLGWKPETFKFTKDKRSIPQVRKEVDQEKVLCHSVLKLKDKEPGIEHLEGITILAHRIGILKAWLKDVDDKGYIKAQISGFTNTLRFKHKTIVNVPGIFKPWGKEIRSLLIAPEGYELCGSDLSGLEDRTKQHYMWKYDPNFVREMTRPDFDPHLDLALIAEAVTPEQVRKYLSKEDTSIKGIRHSYKTTNYSCTYGAMPARIARDLGCTIEEAQDLYKTYWKRNWSLAKIAKDCIVKEVKGQKWLYNPTSQLWYSLKAEKDRFSTLNQGTGSYCFDKWLSYVLKKRQQLTGQFHDEFILCVKLGHREEATKLLNWAIEQTNKELSLNRQLDISIDFGNNYSEIH